MAHALNARAGLRLQLVMPDPAQRELAVADIERGVAIAQRSGNSDMRWAHTSLLLKKTEAISQQSIEYPQIYAQASPVYEAALAASEPGDIMRWTVLLNFSNSACVAFDLDTCRAQLSTLTSQTSVAALNDERINEILAGRQVPTMEDDIELREAWQTRQLLLSMHQVQTPSPEQEAAFAARLRSFLDATSDVRTPPSPPQRSRPSRPIVYALAASMAVALIGLQSWYSRREESTGPDGYRTGETVFAVLEVEDPSATATELVEALQRLGLKATRSEQAGTPTVNVHVPPDKVESAERTLQPYRPDDATWRAAGDVEIKLVPKRR